MKRLWLVVIFAVSILPGCIVATSSPNRVGYEGYHDDYNVFFDDDDGLYDVFDGYYGNGHVDEHGYGYEEDY